MRPLQMVHGYFRDDLSFYTEKCGLGGVVCNVGPKDYLRNEAEWKRFTEFVRKAKDAGLRIWIYDENGYPSPMAGGLVLEGHPELECLALVYDPQGKEPFYTRPAYEFTHAANNYSAMRRYPNLLDIAATDRFIEVTHNAYRDHLGMELFEYVEAFFTDEPSLNVVNVGLVPEKIRPNVFTADPIDPDLKPFPMVPWVEDLPDRYRDKYGEDIMPVRKSLFCGESEADKKIRLQYWTLVAELHAKRYYGALEQWCHDHGATWPTADKMETPLKLASSGHSLHEEFPISHVPLDGNKLSVLARMDVPGLDELNSNPRAWYWNGWMAPAFPCSSAILEGKRLVMTEVSDHIQQSDEGSGPASLSMMQATAAWQASWGVTEFTLYYGVAERDGNRLDPQNGQITQMLEQDPLVSDGNLAEKTHSAYSAFVGRLNTVLRDAVPVRPVMLYYPIRDFQKEYIPTADPIKLDDQTKKCRLISDSYGRLGRDLMASQIPFVLVDDHYLAKNANNAAYYGVVIPSGVEPNDAMKSALDTIVSRGGVVLSESQNKPLNVDDLKHAFVDSFSMVKLEPASQWLTLGTFHRENRIIHIVTNTGEGPYSGAFHVSDNDWLVLNPQTGAITATSGSRISLNLKPHQTVLLVNN